MRKILNSNKGFTLIELLIVMAIIGVLVTLLLSNFIGIRQRARDAQRKSDLRQIQSALELYRSDLGVYPSSLPTCNTTGLVGGSPSNTYMQKIACDPTNSAYNSGNYRYVGTGSPVTSYNLVACLENASDKSTGTTGTDPTAGSGCPTTWYFVVTNP